MVAPSGSSLSREINLFDTTDFRLFHSLDSRELFKVNDLRMTANRNYVVGGEYFNRIMLSQ